MRDQPSIYRYPERQSSILVRGIADTERYPIIAHNPPR